MISIGVTEIILIVVSVLLVACVTAIAILVAAKKRNSKTGSANGNYYAPSNNSGELRKSEHVQPFTVLGSHPNQKAGAKGSPVNDDDGYNTVPVGGGSSGGGFFGDNSDGDDKTEVLFGGGSRSPRRVASDFSGSITVQFQKHGVLQNYRMSETCALIGRDSGCDILIDSDTYMSEHHAILMSRNGALFIADLNSKNGTFVNDKPVKGIINISGKEKIRVASTEIRIIFQ